MNVIKMHSHMPLLRNLLVGLMLLNLQAFAVKADDVDETLGGIIVDSAIVSASPQGGTVELKLRIKNEGRNSITLTSIESELSDDISFVMNDPYDGSSRLETIPLPRERTLDMASSHFKVIVRNIKKSLEPGAVASFELRFLTASVKVDAHVN